MKDIPAAKNINVNEECKALAHIMMAIIYSPEIFRKVMEQV